MKQNQLFLGACCLVIILLSGCGWLFPSSPDFAVELNPPIVNVTRGSSGQTTVVLKRANASEFQVRGSSTDANISVQPFKIPADANTGAFVFQVADTATVGQEISVSLEVSNGSGSQSVKLLVRVKEADPVQTGVAIPESTKVTDAATRSQVVSAAADGSSLRFAGSTAVTQALKPGDVIVSEPSQNAPYGFLRKVDSISQEGAQVLLRTKAASLAEAVDSADFTELRDLTTADAQEFKPLAAGIKFLKPASLTAQDVASKEFKLNFDKVVIDLSKDDKDPNTNGTVTVSGSLGLKLGLLFEFKKGSGLSVKHFKTGLHVTQFANLKVAGDMNARLSKSIDIGELKFGAIKFAIGPIPVVLTPVIRVALKFDGSTKVNLSFEVKESEDVQLGIKYDKGQGWDTFFDHTPSLEFTPPKDVLNLSSTARASLDVKAGIRAYAGFDAFFTDIELASGFVYVYVTTFAELNVSVPRKPVWQLDAGFEFGVGAQAEIIGIELASFTKPLLTYRFALAKAPNSKPQITPISSDEKVFAKVPQKLVSVFDPEDGILPCSRVTWTAQAISGGSGTLCNPPTFATKGTASVFWTATDSDNLSATLNQQINVLDTPPIAMITPEPGSVIRNQSAVALKAIWGAQPGPADQLRWTLTPAGKPVIPLASGILEGSPVLNVTDLSQCAADVPSTMTVSGVTADGAAVSNTRNVVLQAPCPLRGLNIFEPQDVVVDDLTDLPIPEDFVVYVKADNPSTVKLEVQGDLKNLRISAPDVTGAATVSYVITNLGTFNGVITASNSGIVKKASFTVTAKKAPKTLPPICEIKPYLPNCNPK
jgi:hypothetical protein